MKPTPIKPISAVLTLAVLSVAIFPLHLQNQNTDRLASEFLYEASKIMQEMPDDGRTGLDRLPKIHGRSTFSASKPSEKRAAELANLMSADNYIAVTTWGQFARGVPKRSRSFNSLYQLNQAPIARSDAFRDATTAYLKEFAPLEVQRLLKSGQPESRNKMLFGDKMGHVTFRVVKINDSKCISCHTESRVGDPVGVIGMVRVPRK